MAMDSVLSISKEIIRDLMWGGNNTCQYCGGFGKHKERCKIRDILWNIENKLDFIRN